MEVRVGTSGWSYPSGEGTWNGIFYPARGRGNRPRGFDELVYYAEHFNTVEVNSTFYRPPSAAVTRRWVERTPSDFVFSLKLHQQFTHPKMFQAATGAAAWSVSLTSTAFCSASTRSHPPGNSAYCWPSFRRASSKTSGRCRISSGS
jgi:uncharacterized protein YecE (DUF72 family)